MQPLFLYLSFSFLSSNVLSLLENFQFNSDRRIDYSDEKHFLWCLYLVVDNWRVIEYFKIK